MVIGILLALSILVVLHKLVGLRKLIPYHGWLDVALTVGLVALYGSSSVAAFVACIVAGLAISLFFWLLERIVAPQRRVRFRHSDGRTDTRWTT